MVKRLQNNKKTIFFTTTYLLKTMKFKFCLLLFYAFSTISCQSQTNPAIKTLSVKDFSEILNTTENPQLIDVRTPQEYVVEHMDKSINNNILDDEFASKIKNLDPLKPIFVYCKAGSRSAKASEKLAELGFKTIYNLDGGLMKWNANGMAKPSAKIIGICSQEYAELLKKSNKTIVNFYAKWCEPCKTMEPYLLKMQQELKGTINLVRLDADQNKTIIDELKLDGLPIIIIYENQKETYRHYGFLSETDLKKQLQ